MRVHVQNDPDDPRFLITEAQWLAAARIADEPAHALGFGTTAEDYLAARESIELLAGPPAALRRLRTLPPAPRLQLMFVNAAGVDALAPFDWLAPTTTVINNRGTHGPKAGEYVLMAALLLAKRLPALLAAQQARRWEPLPTPLLAGRRALIIGTGDLGAGGARELRRLGMHVTGVRTRAAPHPDFDAVAPVGDLDALLPGAWLMVLACPLTPATHGLLDRRRLGLLAPGTAVVNIGRGALLDAEALCDLLDAGRLDGAVLDVFDPEPLPAGHRIWTTRHLIVTPHVSCDDPSTYNARSLAILFANLRAWRDGADLPNRVDLARGY
jgi:phosphoglycerate dehydrogenase-like enzyme